MSKGTVRFFTRLFSLGKILGGKWGESQDVTKAAAPTVLWAAELEMVYRGKYNVLQINLKETGATQAKQVSSALTTCLCRI